MIYAPVADSAFSAAMLAVAKLRAAKAAAYADDVAGQLNHLLAAIEASNKAIARANEAIETLRMSRRETP